MARGHVAKGTKNTKGFKIKDETITVGKPVKVIEGGLQVETHVEIGVPEA
jgi:hypothetical protein